MGAIPPVALGIGGGGGGGYKLGPSTNVFATATARNNYANSQSNYMWLQEYLRHSNYVVLQGTAGSNGPWYTIDRDNTTVSDRVYIGDVINANIRVFNGADGTRESSRDISFSGSGQITSMAEDGTNIYVMSHNSTDTKIYTYTHAGVLTGTEQEINLDPGGSSDNLFVAIAASATRYWMLWEARGGQSGGLQSFSKSGSVPTPHSSEDITLNVVGLAGATISGNNGWIITAAGRVMGYNSSWVADTTRDFMAVSDTYSDIAEHANELYLLTTNGRVRVYSIPASGAPTYEREFTTGISGLTRGITQVYSATSAWTQVPLTGPAGSTGPRGNPGIDGTDATVTSASVSTAFDAFDAAQKTSARTTLNVEDGATSDQTGSEIIGLIEAEPAGSKLSYASGLDGTPTIPTQQTAADIIGLIEAEPAGSKLSYTSGLDDTPSIPDVTAFRTAAQVSSAISAALAAAVTNNTETGITVTYNAGDGTYDFVVTQQGGGQPPARTHQSYAGASADTTFTASEFTSSATGGTLQLPTFTADRYIAFAIPNDQPDITDIRSNSP